MFIAVNARGHHLILINSTLQPLLLIRDINVLGLRKELDKCFYICEKHYNSTLNLSFIWKKPSFLLDNI